MAPIVPINEDNPIDSDGEFHPSDDEIEIPNFVHHEEDFDSDTTNNSDEEDGPGGGYHLLPQDPDGNIQCNNNNHVIQEGSNEPNNPITAASAYIASVFQEALNTPVQDTEPEPTAPLEAEPISMDEEHIAKIKEAMANIRLPTSAIPGWASSIPEERWKNDLIAKIQERKE